MAVVHEVEHSSPSSAPTRNSEHHCRPGIQSMVKQVRMDAVLHHIPENQLSIRSPVHRPVCEQIIITAPSIYELETRPSTSGHGYSSKENVCKPTLGPDRQSCHLYTLKQFRSWY